MTFTFKLSRRIARHRAPLFAVTLLILVGCSDSDAFDPGSTAGSEQTTTPELAAAFAGGIPMGIFHLPSSYFGSRYNGAMHTQSPTSLLSDLQAIRSAGGKVALDFAGNERYYKNADGTFSLSMWKQRISRFKGIDFSSYVNDGTIIAHYIIDEPNYAGKWGGKAISPSTVEEMAAYSKLLWPDMATVARVDASYLLYTHKYLDAAWAQYVYRKGTASDYIQRNVSAAQARGLALVTGMNIMRGGPNGAAMTPSQVNDWGSTLLGSSYPCAFISWYWDETYMSTSAMKDAMDNLRRQAQNRSFVACRAGGTSTAPPPPPDTTSAEPPPASSGALPFGLAYAPSSTYSSGWTGSVYKADPTWLVSRLDLAARDNMKLIVMLAGKGQVKNADGTFNLTKWKAQVDRFRTLSLGNRITNGTFYLHYLVDQPHCASCWGGTAIPWSTIEAMAQYSKSIWPDLATTVRTAPTVLARASFRWSYLDAGWAQYNTKQGDVKAYLAAQVAAAKDEGLGLVAGLNLDDASGFDTPPMTASQIKEFGTVLASETAVCALVGWRYDATYLSQTGIRAALDAVAAVAKARTAGSCVVS